MPLGFDYEQHDAIALAALVAQGEIAPWELVDCAIAAIERYNPRLNAVVTRLDDEARRQAHATLPAGILSGVPLLLKDLTSSYAGVRQTFGCRYFASFVPDHDSELVLRYKAAGLIVVGKSNTSELGLLPVTESDLLGPCSTPWDLQRNSGGSSGGAGSAVAARIVPIAHGSDGGGSLRIPASCCGVFGLKPSRGRQPTGPDAGELWMGLGVEHAITHSVRDSAALLDLTCAPDPTAPYWAPPRQRPYLEEVIRDPEPLRIAFTAEPHLPATVHPDCVAAVQDTARLCEQLGHHVEEARPPIESELLAKTFFELVCAAAASALELGQEATGQTPHREQFETETWLMAMLGQRSHGGRLLATRRRLEVMARHILAFHDRYDVLLTPTLGAPPPRHGALRARGALSLAQQLLARVPAATSLAHDSVVDTAVSQVFQFIPFTPISNMTGQPSMSVPLYWNEAGLPIGCMFSARYGDEGTLFRLAGQLERARPWADKRPGGIGA